MSMLKTTPTTSQRSISDIDLVCFSHLRWNFVYQRPQHLLSRFSTATRVFFIEEPIFHDAADKLQIQEASKNMYVITPHITHGTSESEVVSRQKQMVSNLFSVMEINNFFSWYYTPMAIPFTDHLTPKLVVYDCMDELAAFKFAPPALKKNEQNLLQKADIVFTGGYSIYESKKNQHPNIHPFPSSIDKEHFATARTVNGDPADQAHIPHPRFGFFGVIDERFDIDLVAAAAKARPEWQFILIGPVVKIDPTSLPQYDNIHYLGGKSYKELPAYLGGWDVAIIPFAMNESTKYISPTKTPEYLAAGKPVISTPIQDVISPYAENKLVNIAHNAEEFIYHGDAIIRQGTTKKWLTQVDAFLSGNSWDKTWNQMVKHIEHALNTTPSPASVKSKIYV